MSVVHVLAIFLAVVSLSSAHPVTAADVTAKDSLKGNAVEDSLTLPPSLECNCGKNSFCTFGQDGRPECSCIKGYEMYQGNCVGCDCGAHADCQFTNVFGKVCTCQTGYVFKSGKCSSCDCGKDIDCTFDPVNGTKICDCPSGYGDVKGRCEACDCGKDSDCTFDPVNGTKVCDCPTGYGDSKGTCKECGCGNSNANCTFLDGDKQCLCPPGFELQAYACHEKMSTIQTIMFCLTGIGGASCAGCHVYKKKETSKKETSETKTSDTETSETGIVSLTSVSKKVEELS